MPYLVFVSMLIQQLRCAPETLKVTSTRVPQAALYSFIAGAKGTVAAGLVPLCVEKLVAEDSTQLKVSE